MDYTIIKHKSLVQMVDHVKACLDEGWEPLGGIALGEEHAEGTIAAVEHFYAQAMTRKGPAFLYAKQPLSPTAVD